MARKVLILVLWLISGFVSAGTADSLLLRLPGNQQAALHLQMALVKSRSCGDSTLMVRVTGTRTVVHGRFEKNDV